MTVVAQASRLSCAATLTERRHNASLRSLVAAVYDRRCAGIAHLFRGALSPTRLIWRVLSLPNLLLIIQNPKFKIQNFIVPERREMCQIFFRNPALLPRQFKAWFRKSGIMDEHPVVPAHLR